MKNEESKMKRQKQGQNMVEYLLVVAIVVAVLLIFLRPGGRFHQSVNQILNGPVSEFEWMVKGFSVNSLTHGASP